MLSFFSQGPEAGIEAERKRLHLEMRTLEHKHCQHQILKQEYETEMDFIEAALNALAHAARILKAEKAIAEHEKNLHRSMALGKHAERLEGFMGKKQKNMKSFHAMAL